MTTKTLQDTLSAENEAFIAQMVQRGSYQSQGAIVNAALDLLRRRQVLLDDIAEGWRQLNEGEYTEYDQAGLRRRFDELQERLDGRLRENGFEP